MTEHVCEWEYKNPSYESDMWLFRCKTCPPSGRKTMTIREAEARLNEFPTLKRGNADLLEALEKIARYGTTQPRPHSDLLLVQVWANKAIRKARS